MADEESQHGKAEGRYIQDLLIRALELTKANTGNTLDTIITMSAVLATLFEVHPELGPAYERHLATSKSTSPVAIEQQKVIAALDHMIAELKGIQI